jgi:DNA-binding response OmpR family regulator
MEQETKEKSILIVDDEEDLRGVLEQKFIDEGFVVHTAKNGKEALDVALKQKPDMIVLDIVMPEMNGFEMLSALQKDEWGKDVPVIFLTNSSSLETISKAVEFSSAEYIVKTDIGLDEIVKRVKERMMR